MAFARCAQSSARLTQGLHQAAYQSGEGAVPVSSFFKLFTSRAPVCVACKRSGSSKHMSTGNRHQGLAPYLPLSDVPYSQSPHVRASASNADAIPASKPASRKSRMRPPKSTVVDRGATTGAPGSVEIRVSKGVEDGTGYDSDVEVGYAQLPAEQPWGGVHPAVQFVTEFLRGELPKFFAEEGFSTAVYGKDVSVVPGMLITEEVAASCLASQDGLLNGHVMTRSGLSTFDSAVLELTCTFGLPN